MSEAEPFVRPDMQAFLALLAQAGGVPMRDLTLEQARAGYLALHSMGDRPARELAVIRNLSCPGPAGEIRLRLYDAREHREPGPMIVFFHGGGFVIGSLDTHHSLCTEIAAQMDLPLVAVDYRLAPEHPFPAAIDDCEAATRWVAQCPAALGRKPTGLVLMGDSAGGNAAVVVAQQLAARPAAAPVLLHVPMIPACDDPLESRSIEEFAVGHILTRATVEFFNASYAADYGDPRGAPLLGDIGASPPAVVVTASLDPIRDSGRNYVAALAQHGIDHVHLEARGLTHSFMNLRKAVPSAQADVEAIFAAMKMMLERRA